MKRLVVIVSLVMVFAIGAGVVAAQEPPQGPNEGGRGDQLGIVLDAVSTATGLDQDEIARQLREDDKTLAQIITDNGGDVEAVKAQIIADVQNEFNANIDERIDNLLNNPLPQRGEGRGQGDRPNGQGDQRRGNPLAGGVIGEIIDQSDLDGDAVRQQIEDGATLSEIATAAGLDPAAIVTTVKEKSTERLNEAVADGEITQEDADQKLSEIDTRLDEIMNTPLLELEKQARQAEAVMRSVVTAATDALDISPRDLRDQVTEGQTLADFITAQGGDVAAISATAVTNLTEQINEAVENGNMTQEDADTLLANVSSAVEEALNREMRFPAERPGRGPRDG